MTLGARNRRAALVTSAVGLLALVVASATHAGEGALSALVGTAITLVFLSAGSIPFVVAGDTRDGRGGVAFVVLGLTYALRLVLALVALKLSVGHVAGLVVGLTVIACATAWTATMLFLTVSRKYQPTLEV